MPTPDATDPHPVSPATEVDSDLIELDTLTAGMTKVTAGYLLPTPRPTLIECGPAVSIGSMIDGLHAVGLDPDDLAYLVISHIHLDHAGGAGDITAAFPQATLVCAAVGARHMVDPERLNASSKRVYGPLYDTVYGACTPIDADRIIAVDGEMTLDLGASRSLELFPAPGHAKHHIGIFDPDRGDLYTGDSAGVRMPGMTVMRPATPPPDFDYVLAMRTIDRYQRLEPERVFLAHYGQIDPPAQALAEGKDRIRIWMEAAEGAWSENPDLDHVIETLGQRFDDEIVPAEGDADAEGRVNLLSGVESNAMGLTRYLKLREEGRVEPGSA